MKSTRKPILKVESVSFAYQAGDTDIPAVRDINLEVNAGELVAIQGPSGSGKSTLLYIMGGLLRPDSGKVLLDGKDLGDFSDSELAQVRNQEIGFVFQQFHLLPRATVLENLLLPCRYPSETAQNGPEDKTRAIEIANQLGIGDRLDHLPNQLSGGQQQRVAIGRALMRNPKLILADEPTGNLDSHSSQVTINLLKELSQKGIAIVIITHDSEVADQSSRTYFFLDGQITSSQENAELVRSSEVEREEVTYPKKNLLSFLKLTRSVSPLALENLRRHKGRSIPTMMGITIGIGAILAMTTIGQFSKKKILDTYTILGVNTVVIRGHRNWERKATDVAPLEFQFFDWDKDLAPLPKIFPSIELLSPSMMNWRASASYGGKSVENEVQTMGVNAQALAISNRKLIMGQNFTATHVDSRAGVCIIGQELSNRLYAGTNPIGKIIYITGDNNLSYGCRVLGVLEYIQINNEWLKPNLQVIMPYTYFQAVNDFWRSQNDSVLLSFAPGTDIEKSARSIQAFFEQKYGKSGKFRVNENTVLVAQMQKFLNIFTALLATIAFVSLFTGGIGVTNMMLASVNERVKEIGLRKALGATGLSIRTQFLTESVVLCLIAGVVGLLLGFTIYELAIYGASNFMKDLKFEWVFLPETIILSFLSIVGIGIGSGIIPAVRAEKFQVIEALRNE